MNDTDVIEKQEIKLKKPEKWAVVLHNDDITPMAFVIELLVHVFKLSAANAVDLMLKVHHDGKGVAGVYPYEIAEQKHAEAVGITLLAGQQLKITMEEE